ncbi:DUF4251 domain-containing protein [Dokdonia sp.]|uniref:DUF4251 domain-containing protein n=1 Tax=Dokdonia sp. TaxID=2024995 RepID=UPI00326790E5
MRTGILVFLFLFSFTQVSWSQTRSERKALKLEKAIKAYEETKLLLDGGAYFFDAVWMYPRSGTQVNLVNNPGYITFKTTNEIDMHLPYFGVVRISGGFNQPAGIKHKGKISSYKIVHNDDKRSSVITFKANSSSEQYDISLTVYSSGSASIFVSSTKRDAIRYRGQISVIDNETITKN